MKHKLTITAVALLTASSLYALPEPIARWNADGDVQPEPGGKARTTNSVAIAYKAGVAGKAFAFDGKTSEIETDLVLKSSEVPTMTWSVWIKPTESAGQRQILSADPYFHSLFITDGQLSIHAGQRDKPIAPVKWNVWQHVAVVFAPDHATIYHRGGTATIPFRAEDYSQNRLFIGGCAQGISRYSGLIDQVAIYDRELSQTEIAEIATRPDGTKHTGLTKPNAKSPEKSVFPVQRILTDSAGRKLDATILEKTADSIKCRRTSDNKEFTLQLTNLSAEDRKFLAELDKSTVAKPAAVTPTPPTAPPTTTPTAKANNPKPDPTPPAPVQPAKPAATADKPTPAKPEVQQPDYKIPEKEFTAGEETETSVPVKQTEFEITLKGVPVKITQVGNGPTGIIFFGNSDSQRMKQYILSDIKAYNSLLQQKTTFFLWEYPTTSPFDEVQAAFADYLAGDAKKTRPNFKGVATEVLKNIQEKTKLQTFLLVGNSLGAGIILWDYKTISNDPNVSFLLVSPTEAFMPPVADLPKSKLERTMLLSATGWKNGEEQMRTDDCLQGTEASDWVLANLDTNTAEKISASVWDEYDLRLLSKNATNGAHSNPPSEFSAGHKIIGDHIQNGLLRKIIKVKLGLKPNTILAERAQPFSAKDPYVLTQYPHTRKYNQKPQDMEKLTMMGVDPIGATVLIKIPNGASALVEFKTEKDGNGTYKWKYRTSPSETIQTGEGKFVKDKGLYDWAAGYDSYLQAGGIFIRIQENQLMFYGSKGHVTKLQAGDFDKDF